DRNLGDDAVEDERQRRREQQSEAAGRRDQPEIETVGIAIVPEGGKEYRPERNDRDPRRAGERGEQRAGRECDQGQASGDPADECIRQAHQPLRRAALAQQVTREREQRDRGQERNLGKPEYVDRDRGEVVAFAVVAEHRARRDDGEQRRTEEREQHEQQARDDHPGSFRTPPSSDMRSSIDQSAKRYAMRPNATGRMPCTVQAGMPMSTVSSIASTT